MERKKRDGRANNKGRPKRLLADQSPEAMEVARALCAIQQALGTSDYVMGGLLHSSVYSQVRQGKCMPMPQTMAGVLDRIERRRPGVLASCGGAFVDYMEGRYPPNGPQSLKPAQPKMPKPVDPKEAGPVNAPEPEAPTPPEWISIPRNRQPEAGGALARRIAHALSDVLFFNGLDRRIVATQLLGLPSEAGLNAILLGQKPPSPAAMGGQNP